MHILLIVDLDLYLSNTLNACHDRILLILHSGAATFT